VRLFLALWPDAATRAAIQAWQRAWVWPAAAAPVKAERMHITLHFIGSVAAERMPQLHTGLRVPLEPFEFDLVRADVWPNTVAVLEPERTPPEMMRLHQRLAEALRGLDLPVETRPFRPHVTLARRARGATPPAEAAGVRWKVDGGYVLAQSLPAATGYEILRRFA
jgi:RNA 2',3'-cyclic 3'-phosphodiesterase